MFTENGIIKTSSIRIFFTIITAMYHSLNHCYYLIDPSITFNNILSEHFLVERYLFY